MAAALVASLAACATPGGMTAPEGLRVALVQLRSDVSTRQAQVRVINASDESITVAGVSVADPRFDGDATRVIADRTTTLPAGGNVDVRVQLAPAACDAGDDATPEVRLDVTIGGREGTIVLPGADPLGFLAPLHARECRAEALAAAVVMGFTAFEPAPAGEPATLRLSLEPAGGSATIVDVQPTVLLDFAATTRDGAYPVDLEILPGSPPAEIDLPIVPNRCDPHVVQEDKRGAVFEVDVVFQATPGTIELFAGEELRGRILTWVADWCGFGEG